MKGRAVVQADALAELGQADAVAVAGDFFEDGEGALERLDAAALARLVTDWGLGPRDFLHRRHPLPVRLIASIPRPASRLARGQNRQGRRDVGRAMIARPVIYENIS